MYVYIYKDWQRGSNKKKGFNRRITMTEAAFSFYSNNERTYRPMHFFIWKEERIIADLKSDLFK